MSQEFYNLCDEADHCLEEASKVKENGPLLAQAASLYLQASELAPLETYPYLGLAYIAYVNDQHALAMGLLLQAQTLEPFNLEIEKMRKEFEHPRSEKRSATLRQKKVRAIAGQKGQNSAKNPALTRLFQPIQGQFSEPKSLFQAIQTTFEVTLSKEDTVLLFQGIQGHSGSEDLTTAMQTLKGLLAKIRPEFGKNPFEFAKNLANSMAQASSTPPRRLDSDALILKGHFKQPQEVYQTIQNQFGVSLTKAKATALFHLFEQGQFEPSQSLQGGELLKLQQLLAELELLSKSDLEVQQELGKYGDLTQVAFSKLLQTLKA